MHARDFLRLALGIALLFTAHAATIQQKREPAQYPLGPLEPGSPPKTSWAERLWRKIYSPPKAHRQPPSRGHCGSHHLARYVNDMVLRFNITGPDDSDAMTHAINSLYLDVWSKTASHVDIRLPRGNVPLLLDFLPKSMRNSHSPLMHSVVETVLESFPGVNFPLPHTTPEPLSDSRANILFFEDYQPWSVVFQWMKLLQAMFPSHVDVVNIGRSYEGREIIGLKVGTPRDFIKKPAIVITGGSHAREWISVSTVCYMAYELITGHGGPERVIQDMLYHFDWIFIPTLNVDGYVYTWETDRLWRKNRQPTSLSFCKGIDLDRSYAFHFDDTPQSAGNPCSDMFPGRAPFEAAETRAFSNWAQTLRLNGTEILGLLDLHSYSQEILYPFSYSCDAQPPNLEDLEELAAGLAKAIRIQSGEHYEVASACEGTGFAGSAGTSGSGSMLDYMYAVHKVLFAYQVKLRDTGSHGFLLPKKNIVPTGKELFSLLKFFSQFLLDDGSPVFLRR